uniref:uncharacterized protein LOC130473210 n=1 Tax=Euleptes europaea TaxID=460621 RepID=UPI002541B154|nr:uncharacterized protein LOC130473210 [Euleptes europaea]
MEKYPLFVVLFCAAFTTTVLGYPYGDVSIACDSMLPDHGGAPQKSSPPCVISVSFDRYDPGNEIQVVLEGTSPSGFKAFMLQARELHGNVPVGTFRIIDRNTQGRACANISNSAVSHTNPTVKYQVKTTWVAPRNTGKIRLVGTFIQDYDTYWVGVHSKTLSPRYSDAANDSRTVNGSMTTNTSGIANDSVTSIVSENTTDSGTYNESDGNFDFNSLIGPEIDFETPETNDDSNRENETLEKTEDPKRGNSTKKSRRKSIVNLQIKCGEGGSGGGSCGQGSKGYSQSGGSQSKVVVVKQGSSSGCVGGGVADVYSKHACRDSAADISGQSSYGQSVSVKKGPKVVSYPESQPFPPERETYSSGSSPQSGPSKGIRITIESGEGGRVCDKTLLPLLNKVIAVAFLLQSSSSYNSQACIKGQSSGSQSSSSYGTQQSGSSSSRGKPCGQGITHDSNPCNQDQSSQSTYNQGQSSSSQSTYNQAGSQSQGNSNPCNPMKRFLFFTFLLCGIFVTRVLCLPYGNISLACESMLPDQSVEPQESESPYHISVSSDEYDPGREVKVNIEGTPDVGFKWFMLQARDIEENIPVGSFQITDQNTQGLDCFNLSNSALIQTNLDVKQNVTAHWVSPDAKKIQFIATIFQDPEKYWVVVPSIVLFPRNSSEAADDSETDRESQSAQVLPKSRKKSAGITLRINCGQGGSYASSSECTKIYQGSSSGTYSGSQGGVVYQGGTKKGGCLGGGVSSVYSKYGCRDGGIDYNSNSYGQSVSTVSDTKKTFQYPPSNPYPPESGPNVRVCDKVV